MPSQDVAKLNGVKLPSLSEAMGLDRRELNRLIFSLSSIAKSPLVNFTQEQVFKAGESLLFCEYSWFKKNPPLSKKEAGALKKQDKNSPAFFSKYYKQKLRSAFEGHNEASLIEFVSRCKQNGRPPSVWELARPAQFPEGGGKTLQDYGSPAHIVRAAEKAMGIEEGDIVLDPCSQPEGNAVVKARQYFTPEQDGLVQQWRASSLWMNPPFKHSDLWVYKLIDSIKDGLIHKACTILPASTGEWKQAILKEAKAFCWLKGKINFTDLRTGKVSLCGLPLPCLVFAIGDIDFNDFSQAFGQYGYCVALSQQRAESLSF